MKFAYSGFDRSGAPAKGTIEADSLHQARESLRGKGIFPTKIAEDAGAGGGGGADAGSARRASGKGGAKRVGSFLKQLSLLVSSGTPITEALGAVERQTADPAFQKIVSQIRQRVEEGSTLSDALRQHPQYFDGVSLSLVSAGESGASLDKMLLRLSLILERAAHVRAGITGAMVYPAVLTSVCVIVLIVMITVVLPRFKDMFEAMNTKLPASTEMLMVLSDFLRAYWWGVGAAAIAAIVGLVMFLRSPGGQRQRDKWILRMPKIGALARGFVTAHVARILGLLIESKVPMLTALDLTRRAAGNVVYADLLATVQASVERGEPISAHLGRGNLIGQGVCEAVRTGESTGRLGEVLTNIAEFMDRENEVVIRSLTSIIEPLILLVMGAMVGAVAISMFLPLFDLAASTGGG